MAMTLFLGAARGAKEARWWLSSRRDAPTRSIRQSSDPHQSVASGCRNLKGKCYKTGAPHLWHWLVALKPTAGQPRKCCHPPIAPTSLLQNLSSGRYAPYPVLVRVDCDIVNIHAHVLRRKGEESRAAVGVGVLHRSFNAPSLGFGVAALPRFAAHDAGAIRRHVHARFQMIPLVRQPVKGRDDMQQLLVGSDLEDLFVTFERDAITLVDHADGGHFPLVPVAHHAGLDAVVFQVRRAHENGRSLETRIIDRLNQAFRAVLFANVKFETRPNPRQGRVGKSGRRLNGVS